MARRLQQSPTVWLLLAGLYVIAGVMSVVLAASMVVAWPLVLVVLTAVAAACCVVVAVKVR